MKVVKILLLAAVPGLFACSDDGDGNEPIEPVAPTQVSMVATGNFDGPMDAVVSPDGTMIYFSAHDTTAADEESDAAIYSVDAAGGAPQLIVGGEPLEDPSGLLMSCDGATLYIADLGYQVDDAADEEDADKSPLYSLELATGALSPMSATGVGEAAGLAFNTDCSSMYVTGYTDAGEPALFTVAPAGGAASVVASGAPLESPSGVYVDINNIAWVMDHRNSNEVGGVLWAIDETGSASEVATDLIISEPAGVSLVAGGRIAVIPTRDADGAGQLITVDTETMERTIVPAAAMLEPAGIRTAIEAPVMAVVDTDGDAIYRAE